MLALLVVACAAISAPWFNVPGDNADGAGMQAHLRAIFERRELLYDEHYAALGMSPLFAFVTDQGLVSNHWPVGATFLQAPGWLLGRLAAVLLGAGVSERAATWTIPLFGVRSWALIVLVGLSVALHRWLVAKVDRRTAALAMAALLLGTPLLYYAAEAPMRSHLWGFGVVAILMLRWFAAIERPDPRLRRSIELAAWAGLAAAIRPQLAMLALLVAHERWVASRELDPSARAKLLVTHGFIGAGAFAIWPGVNVSIQRWMYGGFGGYRGEVTVHLREFLLSTHHGALVWCPVLVLGALGLLIGATRREPGAWLLLVLLAGQVWLDAGNREIEPYTVLGTRTWTGGTAFGPRKLVDVLPLLLPGVIWLHRWLGDQDAASRRRWSRRLGVATALAVVPTSLLLIAAWLDPRVCSTVLDGERLLVAMGLGFDASAWRLALDARALAPGIGLTVGGVVGLPLAAIVVGVLWRRWTPGASNQLGSRPRRPRAWMLVLAYGVAANLWIVHLQRRSEAILRAEPARIERAAGRMNPWHEAVVAEIPRHQALLRARLGTDP